MSKMPEFIVRFRWIIIVGFIVITFVFGRQIPRAEIESDMKSMIPPHWESRINIDKIDEIFGGTDMLMVLVQSKDILRPETLERVKKISQQMKRTKGVDKVWSLFELKNIKTEEGAMIVDPAVERIPKTEADIEILREEIKGNDMVYGSVISEDFRITAVIGLIQSDIPDRIIVPRIRKLIKENSGPEEIVLGGLPNTRFEVGKNIQGDLRRLLPLGLLIMLVFLFFCFRQIRGVVLPFVVVILSILFSMGLIPLLGWKIHVITILLPIMLIAIANDYGIHLIAKYQEYNVKGNPYTKKELAKNIFSSLRNPVLLTGLTTIAGMLCLLSHSIIPAQQLGILASAGIAYALAASLLFIPAVISLLPKTKPVMKANNENTKKPLLERLLLFFSTVVSRQPKAILAGAILFALIISSGIFFIVIETDPKDYFPRSHPIVYATELVNDNLGGTQNISVVYKGDIKDPKIMKKIDEMEKDLEKLPEVGLTTSIARVVRQMSRALFDDGEADYDRIPDSREAVAQYFELYSMSGDPEDFEKLVDFPYEHAMVTARLNTTSTPKLHALVRNVRAVIADDEDVDFVGGFGVVLAEMAHSVVNGQVLSLAFAVILIGLLLMILFRSVVAGLIATVPLGVSIVTLFGLMGILSIELNVAVAMLSSIMIGVGVDYTIHFLWRYREERRRGLGEKESVRKTLTTTGRGIVFNAFSVVIGFIVLIVSGFMPVRFFGFLVVISILSCLIGALVLVPSLCLVFKPRFLESVRLTK
ncbi:MAG: MMPL family transporter [Candidatus Aminicenantes bacterium]|jgi:hydrophobe/amphiphile efflux-3 (HAE3) family protein